jgi:hydroxypyruvate reductase
VEELTPQRSSQDISATRRQMLRTIFQETLEAIDVRKVLARNVSCEQGVLHIADLRYRLDDFDRVLLISFGKAAVPCAEVLLATLAGSKTPVEAIVVGPGDMGNFSCPLRRWQGSHPLPDASARDAAQHILAALKSTTARDLILFLISGGASAMMELPCDPTLTIEETAAFYRALVNSGLNIAEMNTLRKHLSAVKGGRLAEAAADATKCTLLISDVGEGREDVIGSGPSLPDSSTREVCFELMRRPELHNKVPDRVRAFLEDAELAETPKLGAPCFSRANSRVLLSTETMLLAAASACQQRGFHVVINNTCDDWEYRAAADYLLDRLRDLSAEYPRVALLSGGEVLVSVGANAGIGGRNQQFALYCATRLHTIPAHTAVLSAGSDGIDGSSPGAGAVVDSAMMSAAPQQIQDALDRFDSYPLLAQLGAAIVTGPTGNNLRDLRILIAER